MYVEPKKILLSLLASALIVSSGVMILSGNQTKLTHGPDNLENFAVAEDARPENYQKETEVYLDAGNSAPIEQEQPKNVKMEAEATAASIESESTINSSDWSLDLISDRELEIDR